MSILDNGLGLVAIIGAVLLAAALLYGFTRNRKTSDSDRARTEDATRNLYRAEADAQTRRDDASQPPR